MFCNIVLLTFVFVTRRGAKNNNNNNSNDHINNINNNNNNRINVEKCILCEELKILNLNRALTMRDKLGREQEALKKKFEENENFFREAKVRSVRT